MRDLDGGGERQSGTLACSYSKNAFEFMKNRKSLEYRFRVKEKNMLHEGLTPESCEIRSALKTLSYTESLNQFRLVGLSGRVFKWMTNGFRDVIVISNEMFYKNMRRFRWWSESLGHGGLPC